MAATTIIVPGFMGSNLVDANSGRVLWSRTTFFLTRLERLRLNDDGTGDADPAVRIEPGGDFRPVYRGLMRDLRRAGHRILFFSFDWRRSAAEAAVKLGRFIDEHARNEVVNLVTHSMGGLVAALWLAEGRVDRLGRMACIALPAGGVEMAVSALLRGYSKLAFFNIRANRALIQELATGIPSLYEMLPLLPGVFEHTRWPADLNLNPRFLESAHGVREDFDNSVTKLLQLSREGRMALIAGTGTKTAAWLRQAGGQIGPALETQGVGDGWVLSENAGITGASTYGFRPRIRDVLGLGLFSPLALFWGSHPILPMFKLVRRAAGEFLDSGEIKSLPAMTQP